MKKITLLLVAAVFVIGMQSCSTEESVFEEETQLVSLDDSNEKGLGNLGQGDQCRIFIRFATYMDNIDKQDFLDWARKTKKFSLILANNNACEFVGEWYVPCDELPLYKTGNTTSATAEKENDGSPTDPPYVLKFAEDSTDYTTCEDVPPYNPGL